MRNREIIMRKVESVEGCVKNLESQISSPSFTKDKFKEIIEKQKLLLSEIKTYINQEPVSSYELH